MEHQRRLLEDASRRVNIYDPFPLAARVAEFRVKHLLLVLQPVTIVFASLCNFVKSSLEYSNAPVQLRLGRPNPLHSWDADEWPAVERHYRTALRELQMFRDRLAGTWQEPLYGIRPGLLAVTGGTNRYDSEPEQD